MRLSAWDLAIERGGRRLFAGLSFELAEDAALIVTGPNGSGKSSLLRALCGFLPVQGGGFALEGGDAERSLGEQAHYLGHADGVKGALTAGENLAFSAAILGGDSSLAAQRSALARVGLAHAIDFPVRGFDSVISDRANDNHGHSVHCNVRALTRQGNSQYDATLGS